ncbi:MAG: TetR/AcrR family transcriptional regulator [Pseudomonadota bacterium]
MTKPIHQSEPTAERLILAVKRLAEDRSIAALSTRAIAEEAEVAPSAVNYSFGSFEGLIAAARADADASRRGDWRRRAVGLAGLCCEACDLGPMLFSTTRDVAVGQIGEEALFWDGVVQAARQSSTVAESNGVQAERLFWADVISACDLGWVPPEFLHAFSLALRFGYLVMRDADRFDPWAMALTNRFAERVTGGACDDAVDSAHRRRTEDVANLEDAAAIPEHDTARHILETTKRTILDDGADAATFREIARRSELSVSSVQHFFGSRKAYLAAAFTAIYENVRDRAVPDFTFERRLSASELAKRIEGGRPLSSALPQREYAAMQGVMLYASRDSELRTLSEGLFARAGQTSFQLLQALQKPRGPIGRLDAQLFSLIATHLTTLDLASAPRGDTQGASGSQTERLLQVLFN